MVVLLVAMPENLLYATVWNVEPLTSGSVLPEAAMPLSFRRLIPFHHRIDQQRRRIPRLQFRKSPSGVGACRVTHFEKGCACHPHDVDHSHPCQAANSKNTEFTRTPRSL
jgi:hypothetical protein